MSDIKMEVATYNQLRENLLRDHPGLLEDDEALRDTLDGLSDLKDVLVALVESAIEDEGMAEAIGRRIEELRSRKDRLVNRSQHKRQVVVESMQQAGISKVEAPTVTISVRNNPSSVVLLDETLIPASYWKVKTTENIDRSAVAAALKAGTVVPGATLSNGSVSLNVRVA